MSQALLAIGILVAVYAMILSNRVHRTVAVLLGAVLVVGTGLLRPDQVIDHIHWEALALIFGMFILVGALAKSGFFRWLGLEALRRTRGDPRQILIVVSTLSALLAAFMDSITVLVFLAPLLLEVCRLIRRPVFPFLLAAITSANIGGSATMVGDPPNVIIGTALGLSFTDFVSGVGPISMLAFAANLLALYLLFRRTAFRRGSVEAPAEAAETPDPWSAVRNIRLMHIALVVFAFTVALLVLHQVLGPPVAFMAVLGGTLVLALGGREMPRLIEEIDWHTLVFLAGLFVVVGGLEAAGVLRDIATWLGGVTGGNLMLSMTLLLWTSAAFSLILDNVPFAAAMVPVIAELSASTGMSLRPLAWTLALGADIGGSGTPIGATANVVGLAVADRGGVRISWREYVRHALPVTVVALAVSNVLLILVYAR